MITKEDLQTVRTKASSLKTMVIGDAMLDRYIYGFVERLSPEAPVPILTHQSTENKAGGAANVALNLSAWGCDTSLVSMIGKDSNGSGLISILNSQKIKHHFFQSAGRPTTVKIRVVATSHHLLRIDEESIAYLDSGEEAEALKHIENFLQKEKPDLIILEDYNKGFLTSTIISSIIRHGRDHQIFVAVDPKEKNFLSFEDADLFKPNLREAGLAAHKSLQVGDLGDISLYWLKKMRLGTIAITLGSHGLFLRNQYDNVHVMPARSVDIVDVCGAGDAVICTLALAIMSGLTLEKSGELANLAGAFVCSHSGVVTVNPEELDRWI